MLIRRVQVLILFLCFLKWNFVGALPPQEYLYEKIEENFSRGQKKIANIRLPNGMQALLISDPYLLESAGAVSVEAGAWDDPEEFPGMAHFVEHLLFLGTKTYPQEEEFMRSIRERGGECNASTTRDRTVYGFSVHTEFFLEILDRFSHFFIDPLFTSSAIEREMHAVHHEFQDGIENDYFRIWRVFKETGNLAHPNRNFSCGNLTSLKGIQRSDVLDWFEKYYVPCHMRLVLSSSLSLERLIEVACQFFSLIPTNNCSVDVEKEPVKGSMISSLQKGSFFYMEPTFNNKILSLMWEVPKAFMQNKKRRSLALLEKAINRNHANSLGKILEDEGLARQVNAEFWKVEKENGIFKLDITLTHKGVKSYEEVVSKCFQAIQSFAQDNIPEYLISQLKPSRLESFIPKDFRGNMEMAADLIEEVFLNKIDEAVYDLPAEASSFLEELTPRECVYFLVAPFEEGGVNPTLLEKWMGVPYFIRKIREERIVEWEEAAFHPLVGFEAKELLFQDDFFLSDGGEDIAHDNVKEPEFIVNTPFIKIRLVKPSVEGDKLEAFFFIDSPSVGGAIQNWAASEIFILSMNRILNEKFKDSDGISCELEMDGRNLCLFFTIPNILAKDCLQKIFLLLRNTYISEEQFEKSRTIFLDNYIGDPDPAEYAQKILDTLISRFQSTEMELYHKVKQFPYKEYEDWQKKFLDRLSIEGAFLGHLNHSEALDLWQSISLDFTFIPYKSYELRPKTCVYLEDKQAHCMVKRTHRLGSALLLMIASQGESNKNNIARQLISSLLQNEFFSELRTRQQTGYKIHNWTRLVNNTICYGFSVQSSTYHPKELLERVDFFLDDFAKTIRERLSLSRFELFRETLAIYWKKQRGQASKQEDRVFADGNLERLKKLSYEELICYVQETFCIKNRKRVAVLVEGREVPPSDERELSYMQYEIVDKCD